MIDLDDFAALVKTIADENKLSIETAGYYAVCVGDTPEFDDNGRAIVRDDNGAEIARITLPEDAS
jgi:hypothetical protein